MDRILNTSWVDVFDPSEMIATMHRLGELEDEELEDPYHRQVGCMCNMASAWMIKQITLFGLDLTKFYICTGTVAWFKGQQFPRGEHTWLEYREAGTVVVLDLTISQFKDSWEDVPLYVGSRPDRFNYWSGVRVDKKQEVIKFINGLGG